MTTVITRYFEDAARAQVVEKELLMARVPRNIVRVFKDRSTLVGTLTALHVMPETAADYESRMDGGGAVVVVLAGRKPLAVAKRARDVMAPFGPVENDLNEDVQVADGPRDEPLIFGTPSLVLTRGKDPARTNHHMADWPIPLLSRGKPYRGMLMEPHARMANFPLPLTYRSMPRDEFAFPRHARMANIIFPLTIRREPSNNFAFPRHARMADWPIRLTNRRKPYTGTVIGKHSRMANWPFPHLINGKTGTNALIPGAPRMANAPIPLLSGRTPTDKFAFPRHARMANLFLPLLSGRKPFTGSIFSRHARMANFFLPLITKGGAEGFSLSKKLGIPTLQRR